MNRATKVWILLYLLYMYMYMCMNRWIKMQFVGESRSWWVFKWRCSDLFYIYLYVLKVYTSVCIFDLWISRCFVVVRWFIVFGFWFRVWSLSRSESLKLRELRRYGICCVCMCRIDVYVYVSATALWIKMQFLNKSKNG